MGTVPALVLGDYTSSLAVIRSLGRRGVPIISLPYAGDGFAHTSRYVRETIDVPHPTHDEVAFIDSLLELGARFGGAQLVEAGDHTLSAMSRHRSRLSEHFRMAVAEWDMVRLFLDKNETHRIADQIGVGCPRTFDASTLDPPQVADIGFPCLLKPVSSHLFTQRFGTKLFRVTSASELETRLEECHRAGLEMMVQELIPSPEEDLYRIQLYVDSTGQRAATIHVHKLRQHPPKFGVSRVSVSSEPRADVEEQAQRLLDHTGYRGYCSMEFRRDQRDSQLKLIEVNARMPRSGWLAPACGVDFPWLIYRDLIDGVQERVTDYRTGIPLIEILPDVHDTIFRRDVEQIGVRDFARPYLTRGRNFAVFDRRDPRPFLGQLKVRLTRRAGDE